MPAPPDGRIDALKDEIKKLHQLISRHYRGSGATALVTAPLTAGATAGMTRVEVSNPRLFPIGSVIQIGDEWRVVVGYGSLLLDRPLEHNHRGGEHVVLVERSPLTPAQQQLFHQAAQADEGKREQARMDGHVPSLQVPHLMQQVWHPQAQHQRPAVAAALTPEQQQLFYQPAQADEGEREQARPAPVAQFVATAAPPPVAQFVATAAPAPVTPFVAPAAPAPAAAAAPFVAAAQRARWEREAAEREAAEREEAEREEAAAERARRERENAGPLMPLSAGPLAPLRPAPIQLVSESENELEPPTPPPPPFFSLQPQAEQVFSLQPQAEQVKVLVRPSQQARPQRWYDHGVVRSTQQYPQDPVSQLLAQRAQLNYDDDDDELNGGSKKARRKVKKFDEYFQRMRNGKMSSTEFERKVRKLQLFHNK